MNIYEPINLLSETYYNLEEINKIRKSAISVQCR